MAALITACVGLYQIIPKSPAKAPDPAPITHPQPGHEDKFRVIEALLRADPSNYNGTCPAQIKFSARISTVGGKGNVAYRFLRSDNASAPVQTLHFEQPGSQDFQATWQLDKNYSGWEQVEILEPASMQSVRAGFAVACRP